MRDEYDIFWKYHNKENMDVHAVKRIKHQAERIKELEAKNKAILCRAEAAEEDWQSAEERIKELEVEDKRLKLEVAKLIDLLRLPSLFSMLSQLEKDSIEHSEQALKGRK